MNTRKVGCQQRKEFDNALLTHLALFRRNRFVGSSARGCRHDEVVREKRKIRERKGLGGEGRRVTVWYEKFGVFTCWDRESERKTVVGRTPRKIRKSGICVT